MTRVLSQFSEEEYEAKKQQLLILLDQSKISLIQASRMLNIPYPVAKKILFICGSPRKEAFKKKVKSQTISKAKHREQNKIVQPIRKQNTLQKPLGQRLREPADRVSPRLIQQARSIDSSTNESETQVPTSPPGEIYCTQCRCHCCPVARQKLSQSYGHLVVP